MAPVPITEDYYMVLEVEQTATPELITKSFKRLALKVHPDRNAKHNATEAFQLLRRAYETLVDESERRVYDLIYPSIKRSPPFPQSTQTPRPPPAASSQSEALSEAVQIDALQKLKQERSARWRTKTTALDSSVFELQRDIRRLEQEIKNLDSIVAAEAAEEAQRNSWGTWLLSPIYKRVEDSEAEKERKDRERQERRLEKDMKERRLGLKNAELRKQIGLLTKAKEDVDAAIMVDNRKIEVLEKRIWARETKERQDREKLERDRLARIRKQQQEQREKQEREAAEVLRKQQEERQKQREKQNREAAEALRKQQAEHRKLYEEIKKKREKEIREATEALKKEQAKKTKHYEAQARKWGTANQSGNRENQYAPRHPPSGSTRQAHTSPCCHEGWWPKVEIRAACPECDDFWTYLLQCPSCAKKACPKCQSAVRRARNVARTARRDPPRARTPSPVSFGYDYD
ncbi:hypothetical protein MMC13_001583 [Lambiella insularis]|nr:hypothetical protein [Lambiella insularis]